MENLKILLIGQPNVGKSSLLNALVGPRVLVSNYPGTTVEITQAEKVFDATRVNFVDTPGIYSISDRSEEEKVTERSLFEEEVDAALVVADATALERSLYVILQILEAEIPVVLALNFVEEAERKGIKIDSERIGSILNVPVIFINPITKSGIDTLVDSLLRVKERAKSPEFRVEYDDHIEKAINEISAQVQGELPKRFAALRILEGDEDFYGYLPDKRVIEQTKGSLKEHSELEKDISITRYGTALFIAEQTTQITPLEKKERSQERFDNIILHKIWGPLTTGLFLLSIFGILLYLGNLIQNVLMTLTETLISSFGMTEHSIITTILVQGLTGLAMGISIALPYVFLFYLLLGLLEDIGLLSRFIVNAEWFLRKLGLPGKSFIPLTLGLGCTAPAVRATRVLPSKQEQFHSTSLFAFVPCSSRIAIIMGIVGYYGSAKLASSVFVTLFISGLIWAFGIKKVIHTKSEPLLLELPPYRKPLIRNVLAKSWIRMKDFVYIVIPLLAIGGIAYGILDILDLTKIVVAPFSPITAWLGLPAVTIIPLTFGFLQKDLTGAMLLSVIGGQVSSVLSPLQIYTFGVAATTGIPCIIAFGMLVKEFGFKRSIVLTATAAIYGFLLVGLLWRVISIFSAVSVA